MQAPLYALMGGVASELAMKFIPFGGKFSPAIPLAIGFFGMQQKNPMFMYAGAGMIGNSGAALAGNFIPMIKAVSDNTLDDVYNDIVNDRNAVRDYVGAPVLLGYDDQGNEIYGYDEEPVNDETETTVSDPVLLGVGATETVVY